jgi:hypothetical protein
VNKKTEYIVLAFIGVVICDKLIFPSKPVTEIKYVTKTEVKTEVHTVYVAETKKANVTTKTVSEKLDSNGSVVERTTTSTVDLSVTNLNLGVDTKIHSNTSELSYVSKEYSRPSWLIGVSVVNIVNPVSLDNLSLQFGYRPLGNLWVIGSTTISLRPVASLGVALTL